MIQSMTGFGRREVGYNLADNLSGTISVEVRSENNRFFEVVMKAPEFIGIYEDMLKRALQRKLIRGKVRVNIKISENEVGYENLELNTSLLKAYYNELKKFIDEIGMDEKITLSHLLTASNLMNTELKQREPNEIISIVEDTLNGAIEDVIQMRRREGEFLSRAIVKKIEVIENRISEIEGIFESSKADIIKRYRAQLLDLSKDLDIDENRLAQEVALISARMSINEECERLRSHVRQLYKFIESEEPVGKKMNFLIQEMHREVTTIGSKSESAEISHLVVEIKDELENIREQVQNIL